MTKELIPDHIMDLYEIGERMDKQQYKEFLADYIDKLNKIWELVKTSPNDMELGKKLREMYHEENKISRL